MHLTRICPETEESSLFSPNRLVSLIDGLSQWGERPALMSLQDAGMRRRTYAELGDQVRRLTAGLIESGVTRGEHLALLVENRIEWIVAALATIRAGAVLVPLDVQSSDKALRHVLRDCEARRIFTTSGELPRLERLGLELLEPILLDAENDDPRSWQQAPLDEPGELPQIDPESPAVLFYTSGTTGLPKGVPLVHRNLDFQLNAFLNTRLISETDHVLLPLPLHHVYPFVFGMLGILAFGALIVLPQSLTGPQLVRALQDGEATGIVGVPRLFAALCSGIAGQFDSRGPFARFYFTCAMGLSTWLRRRCRLRAGKLLFRPIHQRLGPRLRIVASGGARLEPELAWKLEALGWRVVTGYGLTETAPLLSIDLPDTIKIGSAGRPFPGVEIRIDPLPLPDESREARSLPAGVPQSAGEIVVRGPNVFTGYRNLPEETAKAFTADGWFRTGDMGRFDEEGYLFVIGRISTLIVAASGEKVQPEDVEEVYLEDPVIREIGILQKDGNLVAVIVPNLSEIRQRGEETESAVRKAVETQSKRLPSFQRVTDCAFTREPLSRTRLGKLRRHLLPQRYDRARHGDVSQETEARPISIEKMTDEDQALLENPKARQVWHWLANRYSSQRLTPDSSPQLDLGVDSLEWLRITLEIRERVGVELDEAALARIDTVRDLLQEVLRQPAEQSHASPLQEPEKVLDERQMRLLEPLGTLSSAIATVFFSLNRLLMRTVFRLQVQGLENLPEGQFVITPNHLSHLDSFAIAAALNNKQLRNTYWAAWTGVAFKNPLRRLLSRLAHSLPIDPDRAVASSLAFGALALQRRRNLVWFPEGQRSDTGKLQPFKPGIGMLLDRSPVPVVPVFIHGTYEAMPVGRKLPVPTPLGVVFGKPLDPRELAKAGEGDQTPERITWGLHEKVAALADSKRRRAEEIGHPTAAVR